MSTPESKPPGGNWVPPHYAGRASPGPWKWVPFKNWDGGLRAADGTWVISNDETDNTPENPHDATLISAAPEMAAMLRELEGVSNEEYGRFECPVCSWMWDHSDTEPMHKPDCRLAALLSRVGR